MAGILQQTQRSLISFAVLLLTSAAQGQATPPQTVLDILQQMSRQASVIFTGKVIAIRSATPENPSVTEIDFRVDDPILGCTTGTYTLREWAGLWTVDNQRYRVGQRLLMLLYTPNAAGITSPVGGLDGAIPIRQGGTALPSSNTPPPPPYVDLRWLGAKLPHPVTYPSQPAPISARFTSTPQSATTSVNSPTTLSTNTSPNSASVPAQQTSVAAVINMLTTWQKAQNVAP